MEHVSETLGGFVRVNAPPVQEVVASCTNFIQGATRGRDSVEGRLWELWSAIIKLADEVSLFQQARLVTFLDELRKHEVNDLNTGRVVMAHGSAVWRELPTFGWAARDSFNEPTSALNAFFARLTAVARGSSDPLDFAMYGLWMLRDAFEDTRTDPDNVVSACMWMKYASTALWRAVQAKRVMPQRCGVPGAAYEARGWKGFTKDRWDVWKNGFRSAKANLGNDKQDVKKRIAEALGEMERVSGA